MMFDPRPHRHVDDQAIALFVDFAAIRTGGEEVAWQWLAVTECLDCWGRFNALRWRRSRGAQELNELKAYLGARFEDGRDGTLALAERWRQLNPQTPEQIADFYRGADDYLYDLALFHASGERMRYPLELLRLAGEHDVSSALEYGCGIGSDGLALREASLDLSFMDYRGPVTDYLRWRLRRRGISEGSVCYVGEDEIPPADMVFALDVFEHVPEPETLAEVLAGCARKLLVYNVLFRVDSDTICPMHLAGHDPATVAHNIEDRLASLGLTQINDDPLLTVWRR